MLFKIFAVSLFAVSAVNADAGADARLRKLPAYLAKEIMPDEIPASTEYTRKTTSTTSSTTSSPTSSPSPSTTTSISSTSIIYPLEASDSESTLASNSTPAFDSAAFKLEIPPQFAISDEDPTFKAGESPTLEQLHTLCTSPTWLPKTENFVTSDIIPWLQQYALEHTHTPGYKGLFHSLTAEFLHSACTPRTCPTTCIDITSAVLANGYSSTYARRMYFFLASTLNINKVFDTVLHELEVAQNNVGLWAPRMGSTFFWSEPTHYEKTYNALMSFFNSFLQAAISSAVVFADFGELAAASSGVEALLGEGLAQAEHRGAGALEIVELRRRIVDAQRRTQRLEGLHTALGSKWWNGGVMPWGAGMLPDQIFSQVGRFVAWEGSEGAKGENGELLMVAVQRISAEARKAVRKGVDDLWKGDDIDGAGNTALSKLLEPGAFIESNPDALAFWRSPKTEENLTRALALRTINIAWASQPTWISCTTTFLAPDPRKNTYSAPTIPVASCEQDHSGSQDLKACVDNMVCYLNRWNSRGGPHAHQLERPFGWELLAATPWKTSAEAIIKSSYKTYLQKKNPEDKHRNVDILTTSSLKLEQLGEILWDDTASGVFQIPVCVSDFNWNGPVEPVFSMSCDANPWCRKKALPCYCGVWGEETRELWEDSGLWALKSAKEEYRKHLCPRRIKQRIQDPLERWVALCRLDVRRSHLGWKLAGAHPMCAVVIEALKNMGSMGPADIEPGMKTELACLSGAVRDRGCTLMQFSYGAGNAVKLIDNELDSSAPGAQSGGSFPFLPELGLERNIVT